MNLKEAKIRCDSDKYYYPDVIHSTDGLGKFPELNTIGIPTWYRIGKTEKPRKVTVKITTYRGIASNAIHYYAKIIADGVYTGDLNNPEKTVNLTKQQIEENPLLDYTYNFTLRRPITQKEIDSDPEKLYYFQEGDLTEKYENIDELVSDVKEILKLRFVGNWDYIIQYPRGNKEIIKI
jgi:hypothetical protein